LVASELGHGVTDTDNAFRSTRQEATDPMPPPTGVSNANPPDQRRSTSVTLGECGQQISMKKKRLNHVWRVFQPGLSQS